MGVGWNAREAQAVIHDQNGFIIAGQIHVALPEESVHCTFELGNKGIFQPSLIAEMKLGRTRPTWAKIRKSSTEGICSNDFAKLSVKRTW